MKNILIDMPVDAGALERLRSVPGVHVRLTEPVEDVRPLPGALIGDIHILFCAFPPENFAEMKCVELIQIYSVGCSQLHALGLPQKVYAL